MAFVSNTPELEPFRAQLKKMGDELIDVEVNLRNNVYKGAEKKKMTAKRDYLVKQVDLLLLYDAYATNYIQKISSFVAHRHRNSCKENVQ